MAGLPIPSLEDQIRARWGAYGDWRSADQDQVADLARLLQANGISDLSQLKFNKREYDIAPQSWETEGGTLETLGDRRTTFDVMYGDKNLGFLGDINRDGSISAMGNGGLTDRGDNGAILGWSSRGGGNTNFRLVENPNTGEVVVAPVWGSSKTNTYNDIRGIASIAALAAGAYYAPQAGIAGQMGTGALQGYGTALTGNMLANPDGSVDSLARSTLSGAATGAVAGGVKGMGQNYGWNPAVTRAVSSGATTALRGGDGSDILTSTLMSGANGLASQGYFTGDPNIDRALVSGGSTLLRGGGLQDAVVGGGMAYLNGTLRSNSVGNSLAGGSQDMQLDPSVLNYDTGSASMSGNIFSDMDSVTLPTDIGDGGGYNIGNSDPYVDTDNFFDQGYGNTGTGLPDRTTGYDPSVDNRAGVRGSDGYGDEGMTGDQTALHDRILSATGNRDLAATMASNPLVASMLNGMTSQGIKEFLNSTAGKALLTGGGLALMRNAKTGDPTDIQRTGDDATRRANRNDDYFNSTFLPQYLGLMQQAQDRDRQMYDFNMGRARLAAGQMDKFYNAVDQFDSEGGRARARGEAVAQARQANQGNLDMSQRRLNAMGINPGDGRYIGMLKDLTMRSSLNEAMAANTVDRAMKAEGINLRGQAAGLRGADASYAANALQGAGLGMNAVGQAQQGWQNNNQGWNATTGLGLNAYNTLYQGQTGVNVANTGGWNGIIGYGLGQMMNRNTNQTQWSG